MSHQTQVRKLAGCNGQFFVFNGCFNLFYFIYGKNDAKNDVVKHNMRDVCFFTSVEAAILILEKQG